VEFTCTVTGRAPAALAWERYVHPARWPSWSPQIRRVECCDDVLRTGSVGVVHALLGVKVPFEVTEFDDERRTWSFTARLPLSVRLHLTHTVQDAGTGCRTGLVVRGPAPVVVGYLPVARLALFRLVLPVRGTR